MKRETVRIEGGIARNPAKRLKNPVGVSFCEDEHIAIAGENGSGKSLLVDMITGKSPLLEGSIRYDFYPSASTLAYENIKYITFRDSYGAADANYYYQQRWNAHDLDEVPTVASQLEVESDPGFRSMLYDVLNIHPLLDKKLILLSSGELRRYQLVKTLLSKPRILIVDNPYIGLDAATRDTLTALFERLAGSYPLQIIVVLSSLDTIPSFITHVLEVDGMECKLKTGREEYLSSFMPDDSKGRLDPRLKEGILSMPVKPQESDAGEIVKLSGVTVRYGERTILKSLDWVVNRGEKWALSGENGAGKSTLLSLICADNPQSYACDISLFGKRRGSGESIWSIKRNIGYVSPEMHRSYQQNVPAIDIVASGLHDSIGLYRRPDPSQKDVCRFWL